MKVKMLLLAVYGSIAVFVLGIAFAVLLNMAGRV